jgi:hypothetical protein
MIVPLVNNELKILRIEPVIIYSDIHSMCVVETCFFRGFYVYCLKVCTPFGILVGINPFALELDIYSLAHHLCTM